MNKLELNHDEFRAFLKQDVVPILQETAQARVGAVEGNFKTDLLDLPSRAVVRISCADAKTARANMKDNLLLKVIK